MSIRETLDKHPRTVMAVVAVAVTVGIWVDVSSSRKPPLIPSKTKVFFTDDDGQTWYPEMPETIAPSDHNGKTAVRCYVFQAPGAKPFVAYETKLPQSALDHLKQMPANQRPNMSVLGDQVVVKRPGDAEWVSPGSRKGQDIFNKISGPDAENAVQIIPS